jgi:hypothetical protein
MENFTLPSGEGFEEYCLRTFKCSLHGNVFPYSLRETYHLVYSSWDEAVKELLENGVEGFTYQISPDGEDYLLSFVGFTMHVVMQDETLKFLACFCNTTYRQQMSIFDIPVHYETICEKKADGKMRILQVPINGFSPNAQDSQYLGFMKSSGDLYAKSCFDKYIKKSRFSESTASIAESFGMPEEGLLCTLKQNGVIVAVDEDEEGNSSWELTEDFMDRGFTVTKTGVDGKPEIQWTYDGVYYIWLLLTKNCKVRPCYERGNRELRE